MLITSAAQALHRSRQVHVNGRDYTLAEYVGAAPSTGEYVEGNEAKDNGQPQGFLVIQPPGAVTPAHFHEPNQFQVFVEGDGRIGAHPVTPLTVQYANGHTPYGPIVASDTGIRYFTLRQRWDAGAKYLPGARAMLVKGNQRARIKGSLTVGRADERQNRSAPVAETVFETEADGMAGWLYRLGPDQACTLPEPASGGGQYLLVLGGEILVDGQEYPRHAVAFIARDETAARVTASKSGVDLLVMQFPTQA